MPDWTLENPEGIGSAEVVIALSPGEGAGSVRHAAEQASTGLTQYLKGRAGVLVCCDRPGTGSARDAFFSAEVQVPRVYVSASAGTEGKGSSLKNLFQLVRDLGARAVVVLDAASDAVTPKWIRSLAEPLFDDFRFVAPLYLCHKYDDTLTNNLVYPLTRSLYGRRVRQPIGGDLAFSGDLARYFLEHETWDEDVARHGIDIWMTTLAMYYRQPISQVFLGRPRSDRARGPAADLGPRFRQVLGTVFHLMESFAPFWRDVKWSRPTAIFGFGLGEGELPAPVNVDRDELYARFKEGAAAFADVWKEALAPPTMRKLQEVIELDAAHFEFPVPLWAHVLFDVAVGYRDRILPSERLLDSVGPLYLGRALSFVKATEGMGYQQSEEQVEEQCLAFEESKPYLLERWGA